VIACALALALVLPAASWALDWGKAGAAEVALFYPGQMSWEKVLTASSHKGATKFRAGETCHSCHHDEAAEMGASQAELDSFAGRNAVTVQVRAAVEADSLHLQLSGPAVDGKAPSVAIMLGNDALKSTAQAGCWAACHDDAPGMASDSGQKLGKYLPRSRSKNTATGGGDSVRPQAELDAALAAGEFLDVLEIEASGKGERGHVLEKLHMSAVAGGASMRIENGRWVAEIQRPLQAAGSGQLALEAGKVYHIGIALHDPGSEGRAHLVSLAKSLAIGSGAADIVAAGQ
jgi:cytochrome c-type protein NapC